MESNKQIDLSHRDVGLPGFPVHPVSALDEVITILQLWHQSVRDFSYVEIRNKAARIPRRVQGDENIACTNVTMENLL